MNFSNTRNLILNTDSYKPSHYLQVPPNTEAMFDYVASRGGIYPKTVFYGLQILLKEYLQTPITMQDIDEAEMFLTAHGEPFNREGWEYILKKYNGYMPVRIKAVPEGTVVPTGNVLVTVESTDAKLFWLPSYLETMIMRAVWYGSTVATNSWSIKQIIREYLEDTGDVTGLAFKLHDFGARGVSSFESAGVGGSAHLTNFLGSDTITGALYAMKYYNETDMVSFSIPAAEHGTITLWCKRGEVDAYRNMLKQFAKPGKLVAVVSDSYDIFNAIENLWGKELKEEVIESGATVVIRPDSGHPATVVTKAALLLDAAYGSTVNSKGYKVLNHVRIIQGDGIDEESITEILATLRGYGFSADNVAFGCGAGLLQNLNRDTCKFAMKCSAAKIDGEWRDVYKNPVTDPGKKSMKGRLMLYRNHDTGELFTDREGLDHEEMLHTVYENGVITKEYTFSEVRANTERC